MLGVVPAENSDVSRSGELRTSDGRRVRYSSTLNEECYIVQNPDALAPAPGAKAEEILTFTDTNLPAGYIVDRGRSHNLIMSVPLETLTEKADRDRIMSEFLKSSK